MSWITCTVYICTYSPCHNTHYCLSHLCSIHEVSGQLIDLTSFTDMLNMSHSLVGVHVVYMYCKNVTLPKVMEDEGLVYSAPAT